MLSEILDRLYARKKIKNKEEILASILAREKIGSTGIGKGVAVPHARLESVEEMVLFVGISRQGIDFAALDGEPVHIIMLLLTPTSEMGSSLKTLAHIARMVNDKLFKEQLRQASTNDELFTLLKQGSLDKEQMLLIREGGKK